MFNTDQNIVIKLSQGFQLDFSKLLKRTTCYIKSVILVIMLNKLNLKSAIKHQTIKSKYFK